MMDTSTAPTTMGLEDCAIIYNPIEVDSDKISTKLKDTISELNPSSNSASAAGSFTSLRISKMSQAAEKTRAKKIVSERSSVFVMTEDMLTDARSFLNEMIQCVSNSSQNVITVTYKVSHDQVPDILKKHDVLDWEDKDFKSKFRDLLKGENRT